MKIVIETTLEDIIAGAIIVIGILLISFFFVEKTAEVVLIDAPKADFGQALTGLALLFFAIFMDKEKEESIWEFLKRKF